MRRILNFIFPFIFLLLFFLSPKNFLINNVASAVNAPTKLTAITTCGKDAKTGNFTVSTITFTWDSSYGSTEDYFQTNGMPKEIDVGRGGQNEGGNYSTVLPSYMTNDNTPLPYNTTYQWHVRTHDTGNCLFGCDATTNAPQSVTSEDCTAQPLPSDTYDCDTTGNWACVKHTGGGSGIYKTLGECQAYHACVEPQADYNYTCKNRDPKCSDLTQYPQSKCVDFGSALSPCPLPPNGCMMTNATVTPNTHSCAQSDYNCNTVQTGGTCIADACTGGAQGNCQDGLFCDTATETRTAITTGTCKTAPSDWGSPCYACATTDHWSTTQNSCTSADGKTTTKYIEQNYCNVLGDGKEVCYQGTGCVNLENQAGGVFNVPTFPPPSPVCDQTGPNQYQCRTAIGDIATSAQGFVQAIMDLVLSIVGGIAVLLIIISGYRLMVSQGNPEGIKNAKDQLTAAIIGLLFVIFSLVILQIIGYNILGLPGFKP